MLNTIMWGLQMCLADQVVDTTRRWRPTRPRNQGSQRAVSPLLLLVVPDALGDEIDAPQQIRIDPRGQTVPDRRARLDQFQNDVVVWSLGLRVVCIPGVKPSTKNAGSAWKCVVSSCARVPSRCCCSRPQSSIAQES